jgi:hypothetical protein
VGGLAVVIRRDPEAAWLSLSWSQRRQIMQYARRGELHPRREFASISVSWAHHRLGKKTARGRRDWSVGALLASLLGDAGLGTYLGTSLAERRAARKLLAVERLNNQRLGHEP